MIIINYSIVIQNLNQFSNTIWEQWDNFLPLYKHGLSGIWFPRWLIFWVLIGFEAALCYLLKSMLKWQHMD